MADLPPPSRWARFRAWRRRHKIGLRLERWYPVTLGVVAGLAFAVFSPTEAELATILEKVLPTAITLATVLAGFQATAQSVLIALIDSPAWRYLQRLEHDTRLVNYHWSTMISLFMFIGLSLAVLVAQAVGGSLEQFNAIVPAVLGGVLVWSCASTYRISRLMVNLLRQRDDDMSR